MAEIFPWFILFLPLAAVIGIVFLTQAKREYSARLSIGAIVIGFWLSVLLCFDSHPDVKPLELRLNWLTVGDWVVDFGLRLDSLSLLMLLVVTGVGGAIHIYSYGYMAEDNCFIRFFACMSLFTFSMLGIVLANNFVMMFIFWELVGVSSYLLIGFWHQKPSAADAAKKAFITNRIGDFGFLVGIIILWATLGSVHFGTLEQKLAANPQALGGLSTLIGLLIFCGAVGKSAQFPLHVWLPDAMEGPTPVSALIHAATMVAAGVFMLCRVFFLFDVTALEVIAVIGLITALLSAVIALQQNDIKRILAYSTLSQLGFMVLAVGCAGPGAAMYHLTTHASFKALLFLGAGSVILALHHEQDIWKMGGLYRKMPLTTGLFLIATLALCGVPPLSGFYSKDAILAVVYTHNKILFVFAVLGAGLTAFYMARLVFVAFLGKARQANVDHARECPAVMYQPMVLLAIPAVLVAFWGLESAIGRMFHSPATHALPWYEQILAPFAHAPIAALAGLGATGFGFFAAFDLYYAARQDPLPARWGKFAQAISQRFYFDEGYARLIALTQDAFAAFLAGFDRWVIAGAGVRGIHGTVEFAGRFLRLFQTGHLQTYGLFFGLGVVWILYLTMAH